MVEGATHELRVLLGVPLNASATMADTASSAEAQPGRAKTSSAESDIAGWFTNLMHVTRDRAHSLGSTGSKDSLPAHWSFHEQLPNGMRVCACVCVRACVMCASVSYGDLCGCVVHVCTRMRKL